MDEDMMRYVTSAGGTVCFSKDRDLVKIQRQRIIIEELMQQNAKLRSALLLIREHKLPYKEFSLDQGSNGVRDYFIAVAGRALE